MFAASTDIFADYSLAGVRAAFDAEWVLAEEEPIEDSERVLLRFSRRKL